LSEKAKLLASAQKNLQKNQINKAIKDYRRVVEIDPKDIRNRQKLAEMLSRAKLRDDALDEYEAVAKYYTENGFYLKAIAVYKQMQKLDQTQVKFYHRLAELNEKQGLLGNALAEYRNLISYYEKNQMTPEAIDVLQKMKELDPENLNVLVKIAESYAVTGKKKKSRDEFDAVLESLTEKKDFAKVVKLCEMFTSFFPDDPMLQVNLAEAQINLGKAGPGVELLRSLPDELQQQPAVLRALVNGYDRQGNHAAEAAACKCLLEQSPNDLDLQQDYVEARIKGEEYLGALACLEDWKDAFLDQGRIAALKGYYEILNQQLPQNDQVIKTLHAIYEISGDGDKLFDLMSDAEEVAAPETVPSLEVLDDSLLQGAVDDLDELAAEELPAHDDELHGEVRPAGEPEPAADESAGAYSQAKNATTIDDADPGAEVSLDFLEEVVLDEPNQGEQQDNGLELELELDLELGLDAEPEGDVPEAEIEEIAPEAEVEEIAPEAEVEEIDPEAEIEDAIPAVNVTFELEEAEFYLQQGLYDEAAGICRKILDFAPDNQLAAAKLSEINEQVLSANISAEAIRSGQLRASEEPVLLDEEADEGFDWDAAGEAVVAQVQDEIDPEDAESHFNLGIAYKEMGLFDDAINEFSSAMLHRTRRFDALILKGVCLAEKGETERAEQVLTEGLSIPGLNDTERVSLNFELGLLKEADGQLAVALEHFLAAAKVDHFFRDVGIKIKQLKNALGISDAGLDESLSPVRGKNKVSYL